MFFQPCSHRFVKQFGTRPCPPLHAVDDRVLHDVERVGDVAEPFVYLLQR